MSEELTETVRRAVSDLDEEHVPMWAAAAPGRGYTLTRRDGFDPVGCQACFPGDGSWPCVSRMVADDLRKALTDG